MLREEIERRAEAATEQFLTAAFYNTEDAQSLILARTEELEAGQTASFIYDVIEVYEKKVADALVERRTTLEKLRASLVGVLKHVHQHRQLDRLTGQNNN